MSPSPATGLSKGEREREINSTSFGECKTVPRMYLCLVMSCSVSLLLCGGGLFITKGVWQGRTPRLATKVRSTCFTVYWLAADFVGVGGGYHVPVPFMCLPMLVIDGAVALTSPSIPPHGPSRTLLTTSATLSKWSGLIQDEQTGKFYPFGLCTCFFQKVRHA